MSTNIETLHEGMDGSPKIVWFVDFWEHVKIARSWVRGVRKALVGESMVPHSVISVRRFVIHRAQKTSEMCWWGWSLNPSPKTPGKNGNSLCNIRAYRNIPKHCDWPVLKVHTAATCTTKNLVYLIECRICSKQYIGETENTCLNGHRSDVKIKKMEKPVRCCPLQLFQTLYGRLYNYCNTFRLPSLACVISMQQ